MCEQFVVGQTHSLSIGLRDSTNQWIAKANPTLDTANDFLISINDGAWDTLDNAPTVSPAGSEFVNVTFSIAETAAAGVGGVIKLRVADADAASGWIGGALRFVGVVAVTATTVDTDAIRSDTAAILVDTGTNGVVVASGSKSGYSLATDQSGVTVGTVDSLGATARGQVNAEADQALTDYDAPTKVELDAAQTAITNAIAALHNLSTADIDARLTAYDAATGSEAAAIAAAIAALDNLSAEEVWSYVRRTLTGVPALLPPPIAGSTLNITQAATYGPYVINDLAIPAGWTWARLTIKREDRQSRPDSEAALQILVTNGGAAGDGLKVLNKSATGFAASGASLAVSGDEVTITIADHITAQLDAVKHRYDIKFYHGDSASSVVTAAICQVWATPTQTV